MTGHRSNLLVHVSAALLAIAVLAGPAHAQSDLGSRLDEAGQKLDSDTQNCRPVNLAEYALLLQEATKNKKLAQKAIKAGAPPNPQVDTDLGKAMMLFARAQAAQAMQCMRAAQQQAQPQSQVTPQPQTGGSVPVSQTSGEDGQISNAPPQRITTADQMEVARQQWTVEDFEADLEELQGLIKSGRCLAAWDLVDDLDDWLDELDGYTPVARPIGWKPPQIPPDLIEEWDRRISEIVKGCPRPGYPQIDIGEIIQVHNSERAAYGYPPLRYSLKLQSNAQRDVTTMAREGVMHHTSRVGRGLERENISQGLPWWSIGQHLANWTKEKKKFKPGVFPDVSYTGNWYDVGHWAQMIWIRTVMIGCGMAVGGPASYVLCRYWKGGNRDGESVGFPVRQVAETPPTADVGRDLAWTPSATLIPGEIVYDGYGDLNVDRPKFDIVDSLDGPEITGGSAGEAGRDWAEQETGYTASLYGSGYFYIPGQGLQTPNNVIRPRPVGGDYGYGSSLTTGSTSDGGPIEYVLIATMPTGNFNPYRYYSTPLVSFASLAVGASAAALKQPTVDPVTSAMNQLAGFSFGKSSSIYGSDLATAPSEATPKYGFDVHFGGGPDGEGNWQVGVQGFYSFGEPQPTIFVDTNVAPPTLPTTEVYAPVKSNVPLEIM